MSTIDSGHYGDVMARRTKRLWTDEEKRSIFCDRAGLVNGDDGPTSRSILLFVVGAPPQDADCGGRDAPKLYLGLNRAMGKSELIPSVVPARDVTPSPKGAGSQW